MHVGFNFPILRKNLVDTRVTAWYLTHIYIERGEGLPEQPTKDCRPEDDLVWNNPAHQHCCRHLESTCDPLECTQVHQPHVEQSWAAMPAWLTVSVTGRTGLEQSPQGGPSVMFQHNLAWEVTRTNQCKQVLSCPWDLPFPGRQEGDQYHTVK